MDHYERALYNHILASVAEDDPGNTYHVPLNPGAQKRFGNARMNGFTCCNGTALENNTKLQDSIYFKSADNRAVYVNLFVPSTLNWSERKMVVQQLTDFPYADTTRLVVKGSGQFDIKVRVPRWAVRGFFVKINGRDQQIKAVPGTYMTITRNWRANDTIDLRMPFHFFLDPVNPMGWGGTDRGGYAEQGQLKAIDYKTGKIRWSIPRYGGNSGVLSTAGNVLFNSAAAGIGAYNATTGEPLWNARVGNSVTNGPITYELGGLQYVIAGAGGRLVAFVLNQ